MLEHYSLTLGFLRKTEKKNLMPKVFVCSEVPVS